MNHYCLWRYQLGLLHYWIISSYFKSITDLHKDSCWYRVKQWEICVITDPSVKILLASEFVNVRNHCSNPRSIFPRIVCRRNTFQIVFIIQSIIWRFKSRQTFKIYQIFCEGQLQLNFWDTDANSYSSSIATPPNNVKRLKYPTRSLINPIISISWITLPSTVVLIGPYNLIVLSSSGVSIGPVSLIFLLYKRDLIVSLNYILITSFSDPNGLITLIVQSTSSGLIDKII